MRRYRRVTWWQISRTGKSKITRIYVKKVKKEQIQDTFWRQKGLSH